MARDFRTALPRREFLWLSAAGFAGFFGAWALVAVSGLVPGPFLKHPKGIRDVEEWYVATAAHPDYVREVFDRQCAIAEQNLQTLIHGPTAGFGRIGFGHRGEQFQQVVVAGGLFAF